MTQWMGSFDLTVTETTAYLKGDKTYNQSLPATAADMIDGKWVAIPASGPHANKIGLVASSTIFFSAFPLWLIANTSCSNTCLSLQAAVGDTTTLTKTSDMKTINGVPCIGLTEPGKGTLWIATLGQPYQLAVDPPPGTTATMTFTDWNRPVTITAPPADRTVLVTDIPALPTTGMPNGMYSAPTVPSGASVTQN